MKKIPKKFFPVVFAFFLSTVMVFIITGITTALNVGINAEFIPRWARAWLMAWCVAFPAVLLVGPWARRMTERVTG